jgi:tetratricopeptide (TPR) repeat protein
MLAATASGLRADPAAMERAYHDGDYANAVNLAEADGSAVALALAARARLAQATLATDPKARDADVDAAIDLSKRALKLDPQEIEAHLQLAIALGLKGRRVGAFRAHLSGLGADARRHIRAVLEQQPNNPWALSVFGAWNLEIVNRGGAGAARFFYGATREAGIAAYNQTLVLAPDNLVLQYERAMEFITVDPDGLEAETLAGLGAVELLQPQTTLEAELHRRAGVLAAAIRADDYDALVKMLIEFRGGYERPGAFWPGHEKRRAKD